MYSLPQRLPPKKREVAKSRPGPRQAFESDEARTAAFGRALDALRNEVERDLGPRDVAYIKRVQRLSRRLEVLGRGLLYVGFDPVSLSAGVLALSAHKLIELIEIGHTALHGTYDHLDAGEALQSKKFRWRAPIDEAGWRTTHNLRHHQFTNIALRDPDLDFGILRLGDGIPYRPIFKLQPFSNAISFLYFAATINTHVTGLVDLYPGRASVPIAKRTWKEAKEAHRAAFGKFARYYAREFVFFPALAGPFFLKVLLGNAASEVLRDLYAAATIYCGHVGATEYPPGTHAKGRAQWYVMQVEGSRDFEVTGIVALLCGGLERQIEHHLFPRLPPNRLREIAPRVRALCEEHGVTYRTGSWSSVLREVFGRLTELRSKTGARRPAPAYASLASPSASPAA